MGREVNLSFNWQTARSTCCWPLSPFCCIISTVRRQMFGARPADAEVREVCRAHRQMTWWCQGAREGFAARTRAARQARFARRPQRARWRYLRRRGSLFLAADRSRDRALRRARRPRAKKPKSLPGGRGCACVGAVCNGRGARGPRCRHGPGVAACAGATDTRRAKSRTDRWCRVVPCGAELCAARCRPWPRAQEPCHPAAVRRAWAVHARRAWTGCATAEGRYAGTWRHAQAPRRRIPSHLRHAAKDDGPPALRRHSGITAVCVSSLIIAPAQSHHIPSGGLPRLATAAPGRTQPPRRAAPCGTLRLTGAGWRRLFGTNPIYCADRHSPRAVRPGSSQCTPSA